MTAEADIERIRRNGLDGLVHVIERRAARMLELTAEDAAEDDPRWKLLLQERARSTELIQVLADTIGRKPPFYQLVEVFDLDVEEIGLILTLWGLAVSEPLTQRARLLAGSTGPGLPAEFVTRVSFPQVAARQAARQALRPFRALRRNRLVQVFDSDAVTPGNQRIALDPELAAFLEGEWRTPAGGAGAVRSWGARQLSTSVISALTPPLVRLVEHLDQTHVRLALLGRPGSGKRTLVRAAAGQLGRPLIEVRLGELRSGGAADARDQLTELLARCRRDALLYQAVLYIELTGDALPEPLATVFENDPGRLVLGVPVERTAQGAPGVRAAWPAVLELPVPPLRLAAQPGLWTEILAGHEWMAPTEDDLEAYACRPGLVVGDLVRAAETALARLSSTADAGDAASSAELAAALGTALSDHLAHELDRAAERLWPMAPDEHEQDLEAGEDDGQYDSDYESQASAEPAGIALDAPEPLAGAWAEVADLVRSGQLVIDAWGVSTRTSPRPRAVVARIEGGTDEAAAERARALAHAVHMPLYRVDLGYLAHAPHIDPVVYLDRLFAAAARCGAILLITPAACLSLECPDTRLLANALGAQLDKPVVPVLLHGPADLALPVAIHSRIVHTLPLAQEPQPVG